MSLSPQLIFTLIAASAAVLVGYTLIARLSTHRPSVLRALQD